MAARRCASSSSAKVNKTSAHVTQPKSQGASQAMCQWTPTTHSQLLTERREALRLLNGELTGGRSEIVYATGLDDADMGKAQVGISSVWYSGNPCNMHLMDLNHLVKKGVDQAGMVGMQFNTVGVSDAISMGTSGMRYSLQSRDLIADSIEVGLYPYRPVRFWCGG